MPEESTLEDLRRVVRQNLGLDEDAAVQLAHLEASPYASEFDVIDLQDGQSWCYIFWQCGKLT